jgi:hypothetical protein
MQVALVQRSPRIMGETLWKIQVFLSGIHSSERVASSWKMMIEVVVQDLTESMKFLKKSAESAAFE